MSTAGTMESLQERGGVILQTMYVECIFVKNPIATTCNAEHEMETHHTQTHPLHYSASF